MISYLPSIVSAMYVVLDYMYQSLILRTPVSYPGDPIKKKLSRRGKWHNRESSVLPSGWNFAADTESHVVSLRNHAEGSELIGESAGRQIWYKDESTDDDSLDRTFNAMKNPNSGDKILRQILLKKWKGPLPDLSNNPKTNRESAMKGFSFYQMLQCDDGHWAGDYGGPMFLMPGLICTLYITKAPFPQSRKDAMITYLRNHQQVDGGWGTHIECASTMFGTILSYVSLRLLGVSASTEYMREAHAFIMVHGGALYAPSWAKFWLAVLGVYHWDGVNSIPAEMWMLPRWFPFHPGKLWCHCRMVYLPMCYLYSQRFVPDVSDDAVLQSLRRELYAPGPAYEDIPWDRFRQTCADIDVYSPLNPVMKVAQDFLSYYEYWVPYLPPLRYLRNRGIAFAIQYIHAEDEQTNFIDIGPVNKALNMLAVWVDAGRDNSVTAFRNHVIRVDDYLWVAEDGMKMQGYNGSQCWDTSFTTQAIIDADLVGLFPEAARKAYSYFDRTQIKCDENDREFFFRHISKGGWPFSTAAHGWPISDCTSEGLKSVLCLHNAVTADGSDLIPKDERISDLRLQQAVDVLLSYQNADSGWATYENNRGYGWYELLNPSEVFGDIMIDYSYVECSSATVTALVSFLNNGFNYRKTEVLEAIRTGAIFMKSIQRKDGSWYGSWGNCFTYGTWFGIEGLLAADELPGSEPICRAVEWLLSHQNENGGWGESYVSCVNKEYPEDDAGEFGDGGSGVVQTAWALLSLLAVVHAGGGDGSTKLRAAAYRAAVYLRSKQLPTGDWDQEGITGVFNRSCGITYTAYRNVFPIWALGRYAKVFGNDD